MTRNDINGKLGKYVQLKFTIKNKKYKTVQYFELFGHIIRVEDKNILFKDNYNHEYIVDIMRIKEVNVEKRRRKPKLKTK